MPKEQQQADEPRNDITSVVQWINNQGDVGEVNEIFDQAAHDDQTNERLDSKQAGRE